jgi:hypothetical protein
MRPEGPRAADRRRPVSLRPDDRPLAGTVERVRALDLRTIAEMYELFAVGYDDIDLSIFRRDLSGKTHVVLLRDRHGRLRGFTTLTIWPFIHRNRPVRILFSGDTMVDPSAWGDRSFLLTWLEMVGAAHASDPARPLYWLLLSMSHRTYRTLPLFFSRYYPAEHDEPDLAELAAAVGARFFPDRFDATRCMVVGGPMTGRLRPRLAAVPDKDRRRPEVDFFLSRNPTYAEGDEIVCLAPLDPANVRSGLRRYVERGVARKAVFD